MSHRLNHDYENTYSLLIKNEELWEKMPDYSAKYRAISKLADWVEPAGSFFSSANYQGDMVKMPDLSIWGLGNLVLNEAAYHIFQPILAESGEFLPINIDGVRHYIFNTLLVIPENVVNTGEAVELIDSGVHLGLDNFTFNEAMLNGAIFFKTKADKLVYSYCTDMFKQLYEKNGLCGLIFEKITAD